METTQIVILAGGKGTRMNMEIPKALVPFNGKPMLDHLLNAVAHSGVGAKPIIVVGYKKEDVINHVGDRADFVVQEEQLGTGHAVKITEDSIGENIENVLVLYGDQPTVTGAMIANLIKTHIESKVMLTMATVTVPNFEDWYQVFYKPFSRIVRGIDGKIIKSVEFKDTNEAEKEIKEINPCYFCFNKKWLFENLKQIQNTNSQGEYYLTDLVQKAASEGSIASVSISPEEALGVNSIEELERLEKIVQK
jgi:bifunctional UDP-N-acetylglucosamine pyrophosphorylase/glucosamine-1-phosphate N-acetyltransferase